jgi:hypothetical protein
MPGPLSLWPTDALTSSFSALWTVTAVEHAVSRRGIVAARAVEKSASVGALTGKTPPNVYRSSTVLCHGRQTPPEHRILPLLVQSWAAIRRT